MSETAAPEAPPHEAFELRESVQLQEGAIREDGAVKLQIIRPGVGRGKGRHYYPPEMLRENAEKFGSDEESGRVGWKMYVDHQSEEARRAAGGLPRSIRDLGGRVLESWWDDSVPADGRFEQGAVMGWVRPTKLVRELIEDDPALVEASINARATSVRPTMLQGKKAWLVEGIEDSGSIDWVTEGGAGGRVASLLESVYHDSEKEEMVLLDSMTDTELVEHLRETRPELLEAIASEPGESGEAQLVEGVITVEALQEALTSDEGRQIIAELVEAAVAEERDLIRAEARADADRQIQLRDLRDQAHRQVREARLPAAWEQELLGRYELQEGEPSQALDVVDSIGEDGEVEARAEETLRESVEADIARQRELMAAANPTRVRGQGAASPAEGEDDKPKDALWRKQLQEAGFDDPDAAYGEEE